MVIKAMSALASERAVIGSLLVSPEMLQDIQPLVADVDFFLERNRKIYGRICAMAAARYPIDVMTVATSFGDELEEVGGLAYLSALIDQPGLLEAAPHHARVIARYADARRVLESVREVENALLEGNPGDLEDTTIADAQTALAAASVPRPDHLTRSIDTVLEAAFAHLETRLYPGSHADLVIPTGLKPLDSLFGGGLFLGTVTVLAARPGMGKTAFAWNAIRSALREGFPVFAWIGEMTDSRVVARALCQEAGVDVTGALRSPYEDDVGRAWATLARQVDEIRSSRRWEGLEVWDQPGASPEQIGARAARHFARFGRPGLVCADYLQLMRPEGVRSNANGNERVQQLSQSFLNSCVKGTGGAGLLLSQLNRSLEGRANKRPIMSDLRDSGAIEQDADGIVFLYRDVVYKRVDAAAEGSCITQADLDAIANKAEVIVGKNRDGETGVVPAEFDAPTGRYSEDRGAI